MNPQQQPFFGRKISRAGINVTQATDNQLVLKEDYDLGNTIYYDASGIATVLIGLRPLTNIRGFYVAKPGIDVRLATDEQLVFNSSQNIFKIVNSRTTTIPAFNQAAGTLVWSSIVIPHGLSYVPVLQAYGLVTQFFNFSYPAINLVSVESYIPLPFNGASGSILESDITRYEITVGVDATNVYFGWLYETTSAGSGGTGYNFPAVPIKYDLLQESAN